MSPIKGTNAINIAHIIHIRYSSVVFCSFAETIRPIKINIASNIPLLPQNGKEKREKGGKGGLNSVRNDVAVNAD